MIHIPKAKTDKTPTKKIKNKSKTSTWKFEIGEEVIYHGGMMDDKYTGQSCVVVDRSKGKIIQYYRVDFEDGNFITTKDSALSKKEEVTNEG